MNKEAMRRHYPRQLWAFFFFLPTPDVKLKLQQTPFDCQDHLYSLNIQSNLKNKPLIFLCAFLHTGFHFITQDVQCNILHFHLPKSASVQVTQPITVLLAVTQVGSEKLIQRLLDLSTVFISGKNALPCAPCVPWPPRTDVIRKHKLVIGFYLLTFHSACDCEPLQRAATGFQVNAIDSTGRMNSPFGESLRTLTIRVSPSETSRCPKLAALLQREEEKKDQGPAHDKHAAAIKSISTPKSS